MSTNITIASLVCLVLAVLFGLDGGIILEGLRVGDPLKTSSNIMNYVALACTTELSLRVASFISGFLSYMMTWLSPSVNWAHVCIQTPLMLLSASIMWRVFCEQLEVHLDDREYEIYQRHFDPYGLTKQEFKELLNAGAEWCEHDGKHEERGGGEEHSSVQLTTEGQPVRQFVLIYQGVFDVVCENERIATLEAGTLVGESSFVRHVDPTTNVSRNDSQKAARADPVVATATVISQQGSAVKYVAWDAKALHAYMRRKAGEKKSALKACIMTIIAAAQASKLERNSKEIARRKKTAVQ